MRTRLASWRWQIIPAVAVFLLAGVSTVPANAQYNGYPYYGSNYGSNYYGSSSSYPYNYYGNNYNTYGSNSYYPYNSYGYNSYTNPYSYYNSSSSYYPYNYNNYGYNSSSYPYTYNNYGYNSSYPYNYYGSSSYNSSYPYNYYGSNYGNSYPYNYYGSNYGNSYPYNYYGNTNNCYSSSYYYTGYNQYCGSTYATSTLTVPTGLVVTAVTTGSATVSWGAVSGAVSYIVMESTSGSAYTPVAYPAVNTATITGLAAGTTYSFEVVAVGANGVQSSASAPVSTTGTIAGGTTAVGAPTNLQVVAKTATSVTITWTQVTGAASYRIYQAVSNGSFALIPGSINSNAVTITGLNPSTTYIFEVASVDAVGNLSTPSAPATVLTNAS